MCWTRAAIGRVVPTGHFTLPPSGGTLVASSVIDVGVAAMQLAVVQDQDATNFTDRNVAGSST